MDLSLLQKHQKSLVPRVPLVPLHELPRNIEISADTATGQVNNSPLSHLSQKFKNSVCGTNGTNAQNALVPSSLAEKPLYHKGLSCMGQTGQAGQAKNVYPEKKYVELKTLINLTGESLNANKAEIAEMLEQTLANHAIEDSLNTFRNLATQLQVKLPKPTNQQHKAKPLVRCGDCQQFIPDKINPDSGIGDCTVNAWRINQKPIYPFTLRCCNAYQIKNSTTGENI